MSSEERRIQDVYRGYAEGPRFRERWSSSNPGNRAIRDELWAGIGRGLHRMGFASWAGLRVLDVGCGDGSNLWRLTSLGAEPGNLYGVDLLPDRIERARATVPGVNFSVGNGKQLPYEGDVFDVVMIFTVISSIKDDTLAADVAAEVCRVVRPGGGVIWYDMRCGNPWNRNVRGIGRRQLARLFPGFGQHVMSLTVVPQLARRLGAATGWLYPVLTRASLLHTHYLGFLTRPLCE